ncbi:unnamed protein product [Adineta ricciae]|uniref:EGF-like domain-containing protein n=1 Tax=Adineta ricciae TaxID=249248 RepID=A0A815QSB8_ADIRI|nr:unnamed protein product [Adineta ricciae]CAF1465889.1 unnamed protein product [Adineta ricciae]
MDDTSNNEYSDAIGIRYNCFRLAANAEQAKITRQISSYCLSESPSTFRIEKDPTLPTHSFSSLAKRNITGEDLYLWSAPIDIIEQYQIYLQSNDLLLAETIFYNCTFPRFGSMCQYELFYQHENDSSLYQMIHSYYESYPYHSTDMTCYVHVKCKRGYPPACLDWTEICDGKVDCLDGNYDEEHCWQLELNQCEENEYQCTIGQCIPQEFVGDDSRTFDCVDSSDEHNILVHNHLAERGNYEPVFGYEDTRCQRTFLTSSCLEERRYLLVQSMFSIKDDSISDKCWSAFKCYFALPNPTYPTITKEIIDTECVLTLQQACPDMLDIPNTPVFFGYIYTAYKKNDPPYVDNYILPYLCSNKSFGHGLLDLVLDMSTNETTCFRINHSINIMTFHTADWNSKYGTPINDIFLQIREIEPMINFPPKLCNELHFYQCKNSLKCIPFHRLMNGVPDCPYDDDENIFEHTNAGLFAKLKSKYYKCYFIDKYIPHSAISNSKCDCGQLDDLFCEDEHVFENFTKRTISFQAICDEFQELYPIQIDGKNQTDETKCEQWECDNIYTRCDGIWDCLHGEDELNCDSSPSFSKCSSDFRLCVNKTTSAFTCLPVEYISDDKVDCLGGTDEQKLCPATLLHTQRRFYCITNSALRCLSSAQLCNGYKDCLYGDDEQFCQQNRSMYMSICKDEYIFSASDVERFLCNISGGTQRAAMKHFTIKGFSQSSENEVDDDETIEIASLNKYRPIRLLDDPRCYRGLDVRVWLNKSINIYTSACLCPPSYYGDRCQYQNERLSLSIRFHASALARQSPFMILVSLMDNTNRRTIQSYEQFTYLPIRDCKIKFNLYLLYSTRPKQINKTYSIHIDIYEQHSLQHRASFLYPVEFLFLPVHRLAFIVKIPFEDDEYCTYRICSDRRCLHGRCVQYANTKQAFCQCEQGWSGKFCHIPYNCTCSSNSLCVGTLNNRRPICICPEKYFGAQCYIRNRICDSSPCQNQGKCVPHDDFMLSTNDEKYFCICSKGFSGKQCERRDTQIDLIFDKNLRLSPSLFIHFITIVPIYPWILSIPKSSPQRLTTLQTISQATNSLRIYWSRPFHLTFIETFDKTYYLPVIQPVYNYSQTIVRTVDLSDRCPPDQ